MSFLSTIQRTLCNNMPFVDATFDLVRRRSGEGGRLQTVGREA